MDLLESMAIMAISSYNIVKNFSAMWAKCQEASSGNNFFFFFRKSVPGRPIISNKTNI